MFTNMLTWWQWLILGAVPPLIVALYFLKLKRQPLEVPSTYLWQRTIEDLHVNSLWQRLRQSLLLLLQLLLVAMIMFACLRPSWHGTKLVGDRFIFVVDTSASMGATDLGQSRLDVAKEKITTMIEQMDSDDVAMIISFSEAAQVEQAFTDNRRLLRRRVAAIEPTYRTSQIDEALRAAAGLANPADSREGQQDVTSVAEALPADLYIFSDGKIPYVKEFSLGNLKPHFVRIGSDDCSNVAIVAFGSSRNPDRPDRLQAYARVEHFANPSIPEQELGEMALNVDIYLDDVHVDRQAVQLTAGGAAGLEFELEDVESGTLKLEIDKKDDLSADNYAYATINVPRPAKVLLVTPGNDALQMSLTTEQSLKLAKVSVEDSAILFEARYHAAAESGVYDLIIYDQCRPTEMPASNTLFIGSLPPSESWTASEKQSLPQVDDIDRAHPIMQFVELANVRIAEGVALKPPPGANVLIDSDIGPVFAIAPREGFEDAVLGFEILNTDAGVANTDWPIRVSFPLFVSNLLEYMGGTGFQALGRQSVQPGQPVSLRTDLDVTTIQVEDPRGKKSTVPRAGRGQFVFGETNDIGVYAVRENKKTKVPQRFSVNLFDSAESNIWPQDKISIFNTTVSRQLTREPTRNEAWKYILIGALTVLLLEWYIFNRRVYF